MCSIGNLKSLLLKFQCGGCMIVSLTTSDQTPDIEVSLQPWMWDLSTVYPLLGQTLDHADTFPQPSDDFHRYGALHQPIIAVVVCVCYGQEVITGAKLLHNNCLPHQCIMYIWIMVCNNMLSMYILVFLFHCLDIPWTYQSDYEWQQSNKLVHDSVFSLMPAGVVIHK